MNLDDFLKARGDKALKVFVSWSGNKSREIAVLLSEWIHKMNGAIKTWVSDKDIETGAIWFNQISEQIKTTSDSIIVVTRENKENPWVMFESGALYKGDDINRVNIVLVDVEPEDIKQPLASFNMVKSDREGLSKLFTNLNARSENIQLTKDEKDQWIYNDQEIADIFDTWYPKFETRYTEILEKYPETSETRVKDPVEEKLDEILMSIRSVEQAMVRTKQEININTATNILSNIISLAIASSTKGENLTDIVSKNMKNQLRERIDNLKE